MDLPYIQFSSMGHLFLKSKKMARDRSEPERLLRLRPHNFWIVLNQRNKLIINIFIHRDTITLPALCVTWCNPLLQELFFLNPSPGYFFSSAERVRTSPSANIRLIGKNPQTSRLRTLVLMTDVPCRATEESHQSYQRDKDCVSHDT